MAAEDKFVAVRAAARNAMAWGVAWGFLGLALFSVLRLLGVISRGTLLDGVGLGVRFGVFGVLAGAAFSTVIRLAYRGRCLADISWVRFGIVGGVVTAVFVPLAMQAMNVLTGGSMVPWDLVTDDAVITGLFGAVAAGGSLKLAQHVDALAAERGRRQLEGLGASEFPAQVEEGRERT